MSRSALKFGAFCIALALFTSAPIWGVQYFVNQDGSGHVHSASVMLELLRGNPTATQVYQFNLLYFPNSSGHWILAFLLLFSSAFIATKVMVSLTYVGFVAAVAWLRWRVAGNDGLVISTLIGAALGFNWMWLQGFYNFLLGLILAIFTIGLYWGWRSEMTFNRTLVLAVLSVLVFWSHIVSVPILCGAIGVIAVCCNWPLSRSSVRDLLLTGAAFVPLVPLTLGYLSSTEAGGPVSPIWRSLQGSISLANIIDQARSADSFILISRKTFPFVDVQHEAFALFGPGIWIMAAFLCLAVATVAGGRSAEKKDFMLPFALLAAGFIVAALVAPDDLQFSDSKGGILRERLLLAGLVFLVPLFRTTPTRRYWKFGAIACLCLVILFQTAALWEFAIRSDRDATEFLAASRAIPDGASVAAITILPRSRRFSASSISSLNNYNGIHGNINVWDNYEFGHFLFPVITRIQDDRAFVHALTASNSHFLAGPEDLTDESVAKLRSAFAVNGGRVDTLLLWGSDLRIENAISEWIEPEPFYQDNNVRLFRVIR